MRGSSLTAVDDVSFEVGNGEICVFIGPSGCGKTTTLKMINRLIAPTSGRVLIDGQDTRQLDTVSLRRSIGYVIQQGGLFPNMTVEENICIVPKLLGWDKARYRKRAHDLMEMVSLDPGQFLSRYPRELSGGQQQRIGVIRALAGDPPLMLMDEPFGAIDPIIRASIQDEFLKLQKEVKKTILFVSHDLDEAVKMGDKIAIFQAGKLMQIDTPARILSYPANDFVRKFVGRDSEFRRLSLISASEVVRRDVQPARASSDVGSMSGFFGGSALIPVVDDDNRLVGSVNTNTIVERRGRMMEHIAEDFPFALETDDLRYVSTIMMKLKVDVVPCAAKDGSYLGVIDRLSISARLNEVPV
jgi:osmoprotectant transport system ATP-binding protein